MRGKDNSEIHLSYEFRTETDLGAWGITPGTHAEIAEGVVAISGKGWDAKLYRKITLPAGDYILSARGKGRVLNVVLHDPDWGAGTRRQAVNLNLARDEWRTDWRPFHTDGQEFYLIIGIGSPESQEAVCEWLKIDSGVVLKETGLPTAEELAKCRPVPAIVRGATTWRNGNEKDDRNLADAVAMNANVVRFGVQNFNGKGLFDDPQAWEAILASTERFVISARQAWLKVVPVFGGRLFADVKSQASSEFWTNPMTSELFCRAWRDLASRLYPYREVIWGYDLYNEPLDWGQMPYAPREWRGIAKDIIKTIRAVDPDTWIIYEPGPGGMHWGFNGLEPLPDTRVIYSTHFYSPHEFTHQGVMNIAGTDLAEAIKKLNVVYPSTVNGLEWNQETIRDQLAVVKRFQDTYQVPIFIGEFGCVRWAPGDSDETYLADVMEVCEENGWSWCFHAFREWNGWSFEYDDSYWRDGLPAPTPVAYETERAKTIKSGWVKNKPDPAR